MEATTLNYPSDSIWPEAMLSKARTEWAWLDRYTAAVDTYLEVADALPQSVAAVEALFAAGRTAERSNDLSRAADIWMRLAEEYPFNPLATDGAFESGIVRYRLGEYPPAELAFQRSLELASTTAQIARANLWIGKSRHADRNPDGALAAWETARNADPTGYYSLRAEHLLDDTSPFSDSGAFNFSTDLEGERREAEQWLRDTFGITGDEPLTELGPVLASDPRLIRGLELWNLGMMEEARSELSSLRSSLGSDPKAPIG